jgi:Asp-tRNA(Asn)/Glu-tRNA(Gln) amidotransferase A subunit family amidase
MVPAALGTQIGGSVIRPAAYCGNVALKPTQGCINRGERQTTSMSTTGVHAGCIEDMWQVAVEISCRAGGDPGHRRLSGSSLAPAPMKPARLIFLETQGWPLLDASSRWAFEMLLADLRDKGITILHRGDHPLIETLEESVAGGREICNAIMNWENRWNYRSLMDEYPSRVSVRIENALFQAESMSTGDYETALTQRWAAQRCHASVASMADAVITLSCLGPAPLLSKDPTQEQYPTGDFVFNAPASLLFAPAVTAPLLSVAGMPVGAQIIGQQHQDSHVTAIARWVLDTILADPSISVAHD